MEEFDRRKLICDDFFKQGNSNLAKESYELLIKNLVFFAETLNEESSANDALKVDIYSLKKGILNNVSMVVIVKSNNDGLGLFYLYSRP